MQQTQGSGPIKGLMMEQSLSIPDLLEWGARYHPDVEIVTRTIEGPIHRYTNVDALKRSKQLAQAFVKYGIKEGDRIGTVAFNTYRHFEAYYGISGIGAVMNTINPKLYPEQFSYIVNHAGNRILMIDLLLLPLVEKLWESLKCVEQVIVLTDTAHMPQQSKIQDKLVCYEEFIAPHDGQFVWPEIDERAASSLCYTSGTTGNPKGVLYSHRSTVIHTLRLISGFGIGLTSRDTCLPVVPMFHVNAWGLVYAAPICGFKLVFPGAKMDGASIYELCDKEDVTLSFGVPTIWTMLLAHCEKEGVVLSKMRSTVIGGSAVPLAMIQTFWSKHNVEVIQGWGMTETSPVGCVTNFSPKENQLPIQERQKLIQRAGKAMYGCDMKIVDEEGKELPRDGVTVGELCVKGSGIASAYFKDDRKESFIEGGWFKTGDIASITRDGWMTITDRSKDVIKTGGEWISSVDLENAAMAHPNIFEAAVIGLKHPKWEERPLLVVVLKDAEQTMTLQDIKTFLADKVVKWWLPNGLEIVKEIPKQATGKFFKMKLREQFKDYQFAD